MIFKTRRAYGTPATTLIGGGVPGGMDASGGADSPPEIAAFAENLFRGRDGCVCKRPGIRLLERLDIDGRVEWMHSFDGARYFYYTKDGAGFLRREKAGRVEVRAAQNARAVAFGERFFLFTKGEWIVHQKGGKSTLLSPLGTADLTNDFTKSAGAFTITSKVATVPLISAGGSPSGKGQGVLPPNLLTPLVCESFVYRPSDRDAKRNRFTLSLAPQLKELTDTADTEEQRKAKLSSSARLEVRLEKTDDYGNTVSYWAKRSWGGSDNINATEHAFWVNSIHSAALSFDGDDNVRITYFRPTLADTERLFNATAFALFGVGGRRDRIFAAADRRLYYSGMDDGVYFGSLQYLDLGEPIVMLGGQEGVLDALSEQSVWRIEGRAEQSLGAYALDAYFDVSARFATPKPSGCLPIVAGGELVFYSERGVTAIAPSGVMDERSAQVRSARLWELMRLENPDDIRMGMWQNYLVLAGQRGVYLLDTERRVKTDDPYSAYGYEGYFWSGLEPESFVPDDQRLLFFREGNLYTLAEGEGYHDEFLLNGEMESAPIRAVWQTGVLGDKLRCGTFYGLFVALGAPSMMRVSCQNKQGHLQVLYDYDGFFGGFDYGALRYGAWNYGTFSPQKRRKLMLRHRRGLSLRFENDIYDSAWSFERFALEFK